MARYVMSNRRAGKFTTSEKLASRASMSTILGSSFMAGASILEQNQPGQETARHLVLFEAEPAEMAIKSKELPEDVIVEPEIEHYTDTYRPMDFLGTPRATLAAPAALGETTTLDVKVESTDGASLRGAKVLLFLRQFGMSARQLEATTDEAGEVQFEFDEFLSASALVVAPSGGHWPMVLRGPKVSVTVKCPPLPGAEDRLGWWHHRLGIARHKKTRGRGIRVGVIDTGVGPHPNLEHVTNVGSFIDGIFDPQGGADVDSHGSHVCGTIGAIAESDTDYAGVAPGVKLFSARVFPPDRGANQLDIANAIDELSRQHEADLINLSLGAPVGSEIERDAIVDALERGTLCICAAGNSNGPVEFPAAFPETVAVSAIGLEGWGPSGSIPSIRLPLDEERFGDNNLYHANFSCFGPNIVCAGPGVGILSTVPARFGLAAPHASMGGTSMASPAVCGALAAILSELKPFKTLPRNTARSGTALKVLRQHCRSIGLDVEYEGHGMPEVA